MLPTHCSPFVCGVGLYFYWSMMVSYWSYTVNIAGFGLGYVLALELKEILILNGFMLMLLAATALSVAVAHVDVLFMNFGWMKVADAASDAGMMQTPGLYRKATDLLETAVLAAGKIQCLLLILAAVGSVFEG
ncbi:hypothetical protein Nepgr_032259 [Nepenthes gracilis]|uniref:Uncharacterized protein n=1 Tax=Nepenthes gracilis TaxID=150966 RepID=A0AAD3TJN7_NEPGR|nr:hypothetical protein Nepgr_032259 [Nepenthes gracilis]